MSPKQGSKSPEESLIISSDSDMDGRQSDMNATKSLSGNDEHNISAEIRTHCDREDGPKLRKISSIGPQRLPERPKKPALPRKLPHAKMTLELYNQGVQLESEPESDDEPESDPDGKLRVVLSAQKQIGTILFCGNLKLMVSIIFSDIHSKYIACVSKTLDK